MDKYELIGFLLQDLRDDRESDEEDIGPALLRETTKISSYKIRVVRKSHGTLVTVKSQSFSQDSVDEHVLIED